MPPVTWDSKISAVAGSAASKIEKAFGYRTVGELLSHYPRRYVDKGKVSDLEHLTLDDHITFVGRVVRSQQKSYPDRRRGGMAYRLEVVVATVVLERLLGGGGELVTLVAGADGAELAEQCATYLGSTRPTVDVVVYDGGQDGYPLLVGVE